MAGGWHLQAMTKTVKVWDAATGKELLTVSGHSKRVESVVLSPDDKTVATAIWMVPHGCGTRLQVKGFLL
jgi:WD40 repeat protein